MLVRPANCGFAGFEQLARLMSGKAISGESAAGGANIEAANARGIAVCRFVDALAATQLYRPLRRRHCEHMLC